MGAALEMGWERDGQNRKNSVLKMILAYGEDMQGEESLQAKMGAVETAKREAVADGVYWTERQHLRTTLEALAHAERLMSYNASEAVDERCRRYAALQRDVTEILGEYIADKVGRDGGRNNVTFASIGRTGTGKSGVLLKFMEMLGLRPDQVHEAVHFYPFPWLRSIHDVHARREAGQDAPPVVALDEDTINAGEGSRHQQTSIQAQEGRLRQTGISFFFASPNSEDTTRDLTFEAIGNSPKERATLGLVYLNGILVGHAVVPWCSPELFDAYTVLKEQALDNSVRLGNVDAGITRNLVVEVLLNDAVMERMKDGGWTEASVRMQIQDELQGFYTTTQFDRVVRTVIDIGRWWQEDEEEFWRRIKAIVEKGLVWRPEAMQRLTEELMARFDTRPLIQGEKTKNDRAIVDAMRRDA